MSDGIVSVVACNVGCFSVDATQLEVRRLDIDGCTLAIPNGAAGDSQLYFHHDSGRWRVSFRSPDDRRFRNKPHNDGPQILAAADSESPQAAQRSTNPYSILRSPGRLKIVVSPGGLDCAMSVARRLANDLFTYFKLDADIVHETEVGEAQGNAHAGTGNIVVIGSPSGQYIRRCLEKGRTAFTVAEKESGPPVLQLKGETLSGLSQGNSLLPNTGLVYRKSTCRYHVHTSTRIFSIRHRHDAVHDRA